MSGKEKKIEKVTVRELIHMLLDYPNDWEVIIRSKGGNRLSGATINVKEPEGLACLFG